MENLVIRRRFAGVFPRVALAGVMLLAWMTALPSAWAGEPVARTGWVTDPAHTMKDDERAQLDRELDAYAKSTGHEVAALVVGSLEGQTVEDYAFETARAWQLGRAGHDDGVLLLVAMKERKSRIETGKGVGDRLTDLECNEILRERVAPRLKENRVAAALTDGTRAITQKLDPGSAAAPTTPARPSRWPWVLGVLGVLLLLFNLGFLHEHRSILAEERENLRRMEADHARLVAWLGEDWEMVSLEGMMAELRQRIEQMARAWWPALLLFPVPLLPALLLGKKDWHRPYPSNQFSNEVDRQSRMGTHWQSAKGELSREWLQQELKKLRDSLEPHRALGSSTYSMYFAPAQSKIESASKLLDQGTPLPGLRAAVLEAWLLTEIFLDLPAIKNPSRGTSSSSYSSSSSSSSYDSSSSSSSSYDSSSSSSSSYDSSSSSSSYDSGSSSSYDSGSSGGGGDFGGGGSSNDW